jgi:hypothetical protein
MAKIERLQRMRLRQPALPRIELEVKEERIEQARAVGYTPASG